MEITAREATNRLPIEVICRGVHVVFSACNPSNHEIFKLIGKDETGESVLIFDEDLLLEVVEK